MTHQQSVDRTCEFEFSTCTSAIRIKTILNKHNRISSDKKAQQHDLKNQISNVMKNMLLSNSQYSTLDLMNDFFHIKYNHNSNDDPNQFNLFYAYLFDNDNVLKCDISYCQSAKRYYNRNKRSFQQDPNKNMNNCYALNLMDRIHSYFIHSYDVSQLNHDEIKYIEQKLDECKQNDEDMLNDKKLEVLSAAMNNKRHNRSIFNDYSDYNKFVTSEYFPSINYKELSAILANNDIKTNDLATVFEHYGYDKDQLIADLCDILMNKSEDNILLSEIFSNQLKCKNREIRQTMYNTILYEYIKKDDFNQTNFIKILQITALKFIPDVNCEEIAKIAAETNLTGKIFVKGGAEFKNSKQFATIFKSMNNWKKKPWSKIYVTINQWKAPSIKKPKITCEPPPISQTKLSISITAEDEKDEEKQIMEEETIDGTDAHIIQQFCALTLAKPNVAVLFLKDSEWNVCFAVDKYYACNSDVSRLNIIDVSGVNDVQTAVYNIGIAFWYWENEKSEKRFVTATFKNLKEEILHLPNFTVQNWNNLLTECNLLSKTDKIRKISSNGNNVEVYGKNKGDAISVDHLCSLKIYTDYTRLCKIFCEAFRVKKISDTTFERIESVQRRNEKIANWAKLLVEAVQCFGNFMTRKTRYYRGISMEFIFKRFRTRFNVPLSTTTDFTRATEFADGNNGLVMELQRHNDYLSGFNCSSISSFEHEREILFFGSDSIFQIKSIYQWYNGTWSSYRKYINGIEGLIQIANGSIKWNCINNMKDIIGHILPHLYVEHKQLPPYIQSLLHYHWHHVPDIIEYDFRELSHAYQWVKNIFVKKPHVPNIANACNLFPDAKQITIIMSDDDTMDIHCCQSIIEDISNINNTFPKIEIKWISEKRLQSVEANLQICSSKVRAIELCTEITPNSIQILPLYSTLFDKEHNVSTQKNEKTQVGKCCQQKVHLFIVELFCRTMKLLVPQDIKQLIISFYSKLIVMRIQHMKVEKEETDLVGHQKQKKMSIGYCPVVDCWDSMIDKVQNELEMETSTVVDQMYVSVNGTRHHKGVTENEWDNFRWSANDLFLFSTKPKRVVGYDSNGISIIKSISKYHSSDNQDLNKMAGQLLRVYNRVPTMQPKKYVLDMITKAHVKRSKRSSLSVLLLNKLNNTFLLNDDDSVRTVTAGRLNSNTSDNNYDIFIPQHTNYTEQIFLMDNDNNTNDVEGHDKANINDIVDVHNAEDNIVSNDSTKKSQCCVVV
eukprot:529756_1